MFRASSVLAHLTALVAALGSLVLLEMGAPVVLPGILAVASPALFFVALALES